MLAITFATKSELENVIKHMRAAQPRVNAEIPTVRGYLKGRNVTAVQTGVGPRNAQYAASHIIKNFFPSLVILTGACGAVDPELNVGDIVVGEKIFRKQGPVHHHGLTALHGSFSCSRQLSQLAFFSLQNSGFSPVWGDFLTVEKFVHKREKKDWIYSTFKVKAVEMEGAAMAAVFQAAGIPFIALRVISDNAREDTLDCGACFSSKKKSQYSGLAAYFFKNPGDIPRAIQFTINMLKINKIICNAVEVVVDALPEQINNAG